MWHTHMVKKFFAIQPWWATFKSTFAVIFIEKLTNHFSKVKLNPEETVKRTDIKKSHIIGPIFCLFLR